MSKENYIKCSSCGCIIPIPAELYPEPIEGEIPLSGPYYCDECDQEDERDDPPEDERDPEIFFGIPFDDEDEEDEIDRDLFFESVIEEEDEGIE